MAMTVRWYNGAPYPTDDATQTEAVWYNGAPQIEYFEYEEATENRRRRLLVAGGCR